MPMVLKLILLFSIQLLFYNCSSEIHKENENNQFYDLEDIFSEDFMKYYNKGQSLELIKSLLSLINVDDSSNWKGDIHNLIKKTANICSNSITQAGNELDGLLIDLEDSFDIAKDETYNFIEYLKNQGNQVKDINVLITNNKERESNFNLSSTSETEDLDKLPRKAEDSLDITKNLSSNFIDQLRLPSNEPHNQTTDTLTDKRYGNSLFKKLLSVPEEFDKSIKKTHNDIKEIIKSILDACFDLPSTLPKASARHKRSPDNSLSKFAISLSNWATTSINNIEEKLDRFLTHCFQHETCKNRFNDLVKTSMELMISSSKDHNRTKVIIENILTDLKNSNLIEFEFSNGQDTIVGKGEYLREFKEEESHAFEIAKNIHFRNSPKMLNLETEGEIFVELDAKIFETDERFLSLALGSSIIEHKWGQIKYKSADFFKLASALSPAMLRVGGSAANFLTYDPHETSSSNLEEPLSSNYQHVSSNSSSGESLSTNDQQVSNSKSRKLLESSNHPKHWTTKVHKGNSINKSVARSGFKLNYVETCDPQVGSYGKVFNNFTMTDADWTFLRELSELLDWPLLFDLNQFKRTPDGFWDASNAELIVKSGNSKEMGIMWQVGNEPNNYHHHFNISITPEQSANDYKKLRALLDTQNHREKNQIKEPFKSDEVDAKPRSIENKALVVGPDVTRPKIKPQKGVKLSDNSMEYLEKFLSLAAEDIDVISWHHYYMNGRTSSTEDFVTVEFLNEFPLQVQRVKTIRDEKAPGKPIWITETATAYGGGAPQISDRFAACLPWMDKLGSAAFGGIAAVFRQTLYGGCYALLSPSLKPYPTYWASYVYKRLVGPGVLLPRTRLLPKSLRVYSHCLSRRNEKFKPGSVVIMGLNLSPKRETVKLDANSKLLMSSIYSYKLTAPENLLNSSEILLNGELLQLDEDGKVPAILGVKYIEDDLIFSPYSINFWVFPDANATACL